MDRANRVIWAVVALLLLGAGAAGLAADLLRPAARVPEIVLERGRAPDDLVLVGVALGGLFVAVGGLLLLRAELRPGGPPRLPNLRLGRERGATIVRSGRLGRGLERELARIVGVERADVRLYTPAARPRVRLRLDLATGAEIEPVREQVDRALQRLSRTAGRPLGAVEVLVHPGAGRPGRRTAAVPAPGRS